MDEDGSLLLNDKKKQRAFFDRLFKQTDQMGNISMLQCVPFKKH